MEKVKTKHKRTKWAKNRCVWCDKEFKCCQYRTKTCSNKCRLRLHRFRSEAGFDPEKPPGDITTQTALDLLIMELLFREKIRRKAIGSK